MTTDIFGRQGTVPTKAYRPNESPFTVRFSRKGPDFTSVLFNGVPIEGITKLTVEPDLEFNCYRLNMEVLGCNVEMEKE